MDKFFEDNPDMGKFDIVRKASDRLSEIYGDDEDTVDLQNHKGSKVTTHVLYEILDGEVIGEEIQEGNLGEDTPSDSKDS